MGLPTLLSRFTAAACTLFALFTPLSHSFLLEWQISNIPKSGMALVSSLSSASGLLRLAVPVEAEAALEEVEGLRMVPFVVYPQLGNSKVNKRKQMNQRERETDRQTDRDRDRGRDRDRQRQRE